MAKRGTPRRKLERWRAERLGIPDSRNVPEPRDDLTTHLMRLVMLNSHSLPLADRKVIDFNLLSLMSDETKNSLIRDINQKLNIVPLKAANGLR